MGSGSNERVRGGRLLDVTDLNVRKNAKLQHLGFLTVTHDRYRAKKLIINVNLTRSGNG